MKLWSCVASANAWIISCGTSIHDDGPNSAPTSSAVMAGSLRGRITIAPMRVTAKTEIACPPERVFDTLADLRNDLEWNSRFSKAELLSGEPIGQGSSFAVVNGGTPYDATL